MSQHGRIQRHYQRCIQRGGPNFDRLDWASQDSQHARFDVLTRAVDLSGKSLLDVGCGLGDLASYLAEHHIDATYTGVDIVDEMLRQARDAHPTLAFTKADVFGDASPFSPASFDVVFCSGTLNLDLGNNLEFVQAALPAMLRLAKQTLVVNFLHHRVPPVEQGYFCYDPQAMIAILQPLASSVTLIDDYLPGDFTLLATPPG
jgi:ubiquinone/menaquinone biosynthesis C-methylase UbiE